MFRLATPQSFFSLSLLALCAFSLLVEILGPLYWNRVELVFINFLGVYVYFLSSVTLLPIDKKPKNSSVLSS